MINREIERGKGKGERGKGNEEKKDDIGDASDANDNQKNNMLT